MLKLFDPMASLILSTWAYPYPVPKDDLSKKDHRRIKKAAKRERPRLLRLSADQTTEVLEYYADRCNQGRAEVYAKQTDYAKDLADRLAHVRVALDAEAPIPFEAPEGDVPAGGLARQQYFVCLQKAAESDVAARRHIDSVNAAQVEISRCMTDRRAIDYFASLALTKWDEFHRSLWNLHMSFVVGGNVENPTLRKVSFRPLPPPESLRQLSLEAPQRPARALESDAPHEEAEPPEDQTDAEAPLPTDNNVQGESTDQEK